MIRILFNGTLMDLSNFNGSLGVSFVYRKKTESGESGFSFSPDLTLTGDAFTLVYNQIINTPNPSMCSINVEVYDDCCGSLLFTGIIRGSDVSWCEVPVCECTVTIIDNSTDAEAIRCLKNTFIWDRLPKADGSGISDGPNTFRRAPLLAYCNDVRPGAAQEAIMIVAIIFKVVLSPILLIIYVIQAIVNFVFDVDANESDSLFQYLDNLVVGCGFNHRTPFIHSYLKNVCDICGLTLSSSYFNAGGYYHDTVRLDASYLSSRDNTPYESYELNKPNLTAVQFLEELNQFNFEWRIKNGVLYLERKDFFAGALWIDTTTIDQNDIISLCFSATDKVPPAYAIYDYAKDGVDNTGDECAPNWSQKVFDWNNPDNGIQAGLFEKKFTFGAAQFRSDYNRVTESPLDKTIYQVFFPVLQDNNILLMERGVCNYPKMIIVDTYNFGNNAKARRINNATDPNLFNYNMPWWVYESPIIDILGNSNNTLYQELFYIDNPRLTTVKNRNYTLVLNANCTFVNSLDLDGFIRLSQGGTVYEGDISEVTYDLQQNTLTITGKI